MAMIVGKHNLDTTEGIDKITSTDKITAAYFSNNVVKLGAAAIHSASLSDTNEVYYYSIAKDNTTGSVQFNIAYGNSEGYGGNYNGGDIKSPTSAVYKHWANTLLAENEVTGGFVMSSLGSSPAVVAGTKDEEIYVLVGKRNLYKDRINKKNWTIVLSGSTSLGAGSGPLSLTDDSNTVSAVATPAGPRYNIVSGSQGTVARTAAVKTYGWFYPDAAALVFSGAELSASIPGFATDIAKAVIYNSGSMQGFGSAGNSGNTAQDADYNSALRFINCIKTPTSFMKFRSDEDMTSVSYFCRVHAGHSNFSNNPTFVSGSHNELRQTTMKGNPNVYITEVALHNANGDIVAIGHLSTPLKKNFASEATIKVKLTY